MVGKPNILIVIATLYIGGAENVIASLCRLLNRDIFNVYVCYLKARGDIGNNLHAEGFNVIGIPKSKILKNDYLSLLKLRKLIKQKKIDIIHSNCIHSLIDSSLCRLSLPKLRYIHTFHFGNYPHREPKYLFLEKIFRRVPDRLVAVGHEQEKTIKTTFNIPDCDINTIWNGVEEASAHIDQQLINQWGGNNKIIIGSISTLIEQKGITDLLDVVFSLRKNRNDFIFLIVGDGHLRKGLEEKCRRLDLQDTVFFTGWVNNASSSILPVLDIFIQSSLWEAMPMVVLEAMMAGKPIVATSVGENKHIIDHGENGFLVEPKDVGSMASMLDILIRNSELRAKLGAAARAKYEDFFTAKKMAECYEKLYLDVLD